MSKRYAMMDTIKSDKKERVRPDYSRLGVPEDSASTVKLTGYTPEQIVDKVHCTPESRFRIGQNQVVPVAYRYNWVFKGLAFKEEQRLDCHFCDNKAVEEWAHNNEPICEDCFQSFTGHTFKDVDPVTGPGGEWKEFNKNHSPILESGQSIKEEAFYYQCKECDTTMAEQNKGYDYMCHDCWSKHQ